MQVDFEEIQSKCLNIFNVGAKASDFFRDFTGKMRHAGAFFLRNPGKNRMPLHPEKNMYKMFKYVQNVDC